MTFNKSIFDVFLEEDLANYHKVNKNDLPFDIIDERIAERIIEKVPILVLGGKPYLYDGGVYKLDGSGNILRKCIKLMIYSELITIRRINRVYDLILHNPDLEKSIEDVNNHNKRWVNFMNGMFDPKDWKMRKHKPEYLSINQIPHTFGEYSIDSAKECIGETFINGIIPDCNDRGMLYQYLGYCMTTDTSQQKSLIINGVGGTGKSVLIRWIEQIFGSDNISNLSLQDLGKRFMPTDLFGKLMNSCADIPKAALESTDIFKKATGEDKLMGEYKGGERFYFKSYAKLIFSANEVPISLDEKTNAFYRRLLMIRIKNRAPHIQQLEMKLSKEIDWLILNVMKASHFTFNEADGKIIESKNSKDASHELHRDSDSVTAFLDDCTTECINEKVVSKTLYKEYVEYCSGDNGIGVEPMKQQTFSKNLKSKGYLPMQSHGIRYILGLKINDNSYFEDIGNRVIPFQGIG